MNEMGLLFLHNIDPNLNVRRGVAGMGTPEARSEVEYLWGDYGQDPGRRI